VIGHEIGHIVFDNHRLTYILRKHYHHGKQLPYPIISLIRLWYRFTEISADRVGYWACGNLPSAISSLLKIYTGLNRKLNVTTEALMQHSQLWVENWDGSLPDTFTHPVPPVRIEALRIFAEAFPAICKKEETIYTVEQAMQPLIKIMERRGEDDVDFYREIFIVSGGLLVATLDNELNKKEETEIVETLARFFKYPLPYYRSMVEEIKNRGELMALFVESVQYLKNHAPKELSAMFQYLIEVAMADGKLRSIEIEFLKYAGQRFFGFSEEKIKKDILSSIQQSFVPVQWRE